MPIILDPRSFVTLAEAKVALGIPEADTSREDAIRLAINRATARLEAWTRTALVAKTYVEFLSGTLANRRGDGPLSSEGFSSVASKVIWLAHRPVVSVTSITDESGQSIGSQDYYLRKEMGCAEHYSCWPSAYRVVGQSSLPSEWRVEYVAGWFPTVADVPADVRDACLSLVPAPLYRSSPSVSAISAGSLSVTFGGHEQSDSLPPSVAATLARYKLRSL